MMFESGAIVMHIANASDVLMLSDPDGRARTKMWMFAALKTVESPIMFLNEIDRQRASDAGRTTVTLVAQHGL